MIKKNNFAQAAIEYLLLIGGAVILAAIIINILTVFATMPSYERSEDYYKEKLWEMEAEADSSLVGWWRFNDPIIGCGCGGTEYAEDISLTENDAYLAECVYISSGCVQGRCVWFNGGSSTKLPANEAYNFNDFTIEFWINATSESPDPEVKQIILQRGSLNSGVGNWGVRLSDTGMINASYYPPPSGSNTGNVISTQNITYGTWHFIGLVRDGTNFYLYIDGVKVASDTSSLGKLEQSFSASVQIADGSWYGSNTFKGLLDDLKFYNRGLSETEIQEHYDRYKDRI